MPDKDVVMSCATPMVTNEGGATTSRWLSLRLMADDSARCDTVSDRDQFAYSETMRREFGEALRLAMSAAGVTQESLAAAVGVGQAAVSQWVAGISSPKWPALTFAIEKVLRVRAGALSKYLGYLPLDAVKSVADIETAIAEDPRLTPAQRETMLSVLRSITTQQAARRGRPPKG